MINSPVGRSSSALVVLFVFLAVASNVKAAEQKSGEYRGTLRVIKFDVSPALRDIPPLPAPQNQTDWGSSIVDPSGFDGKPDYRKQTPDQAVQKAGPSQDIPDPIISFDLFSNQGTSTPPDPVGDIGPNHYVTMSNLHFAIHNRAGALLAGPTPNNVLWSGFGGQCQAQNAGDPIVLYDQFADRWLLTQFSGNHAGEKFNCVALSTSPDPMGTYFRWQISNGPEQNFPDYPKYGVGEEAYFLSTRDFAPNSGPFQGVGAFALNRAEMVAGNPNPTIISFFVDNSDPELVGDGLLPMDIDGDTFPPTDSPHYFLGSMDDGGPYGAPQDALNVWAFIVDFATPENSSFALTDQVPIASMDTIFPCTGTQGRNCIAQPDTAIGLDHQGYRQRPLHRAAYRNYGTHESIVTNQSVEAAPNVSGIRWWEVRSPGSSPTIHQEGTFAPGIEDEIQRWFGSAAMDSAGNLALGYSASNADDVYPSIWYSGRLFTDAGGTLPQGEGEIVEGQGSQTSTFSRWGDYTSMNVDPVDDCTFWYLNEYYEATDTTEWTLSVGAFKFDECGEPGFALSVTSPPEAEAGICAGDDAIYELNLGSVEAFDMPVSLSTIGNPGATTTGFAPNPVPSLPGTSTFTIGNTGGVAAGEYDIEVTGSATGVDDRMVDLELSVVEVVPTTPTQIAPIDTAIDVPLNPTFEWSDVDPDSYTLEVATDPGFSNIVISETTDEDELTPFNPLASGTTYYWRVRATNACGPSADSAVFSFTTISLPGDCQVGEVEVVAHEFDFETGAQGWTSGTNLGDDTWTISSDNPNSGAQHWHVDDLPTPSDTFLTSPSMSIPTGLSNLTFRFFNYQDIEPPPPPNCWDGGMLEVSTNGGANFNEVVNGDLLTDPYDGPLQDVSNPLQGRQAWCGAPQPYTDSRVDISSLAGENDVVFRFRIGTDVAAGAPGWDIDDVKVVGCSTVLEFDDGFEDVDN